MYVYDKDSVIKIKYILQNLEELQELYCSSKSMK